MNKTIRFTVFFLAVSFLAACSFFQQGTAPQDNVEVKPHTHEFPPQDPPTKPKPKWVERPALSHKARFSAVLASHNRVRAKHRLPPLKWSDKLARYSKQWANQMARGKHCQMYHRSGSPKFGENLYRSTAIIWTDGKREISPVTINNVVQVWANEERWYDYRRNRCQPGQQCGHYTQIVWKDTKEVGCAMNVCADKSQTWVCSYNPPGNYIGVRPY